MKIMHYTLGFSPERSGGLVQYASDLSKEQIKLGHDVTVLYPGNISFISRKTKIKIGERDNIRTAEIINSLPLPLIGNIGNPSDFMETISMDVFEDFLVKERPDVVHIHTLMGLHKEFLEATRKLKIKTIFTTHDYFGISPNSTFYLNGHDYAEEQSDKIWSIVPYFGTRTLKHRLLQTRFYPTLRKQLKKIQRTEISTIGYSANEHLAVSDSQKKKYYLLKDYYSNMLSLIDFFHFNSSLTMDIYKKHFNVPNDNCIVLHITSRNIKSTSEIILNAKKIKTIAFIGAYTHQKGFDKFLQFAEQNKTNYKFVAMGDNRPIPSMYNIENFGRFNKDQLDEYFEKIDLVVIPSCLHETFGLVGLEALTRNVKTIVYEKVGFSDLLDADFIFKDLLSVDIEKIESINVRLGAIDNMTEHTQKIISLY